MQNVNFYKQHTQLFLCDGSANENWCWQTGRDHVLLRSLKSLGLGAGNEFQSLSWWRMVVFAVALEDTCVLVQ